MKMICLLTLSILIASVQFTSIFAQNDVHLTDGVSELKKRGPGGEEPSGGGGSSTGIYEQANICATDDMAAKYLESNTMLQDSATKAYNSIIELEESGLSRMDPLTDRIVPIVFHIVHQCGDEQIDDEQIIRVVEDINKDFSAGNIELSQFENELDILDINRANVELQFKLATIDPDGYPTKGITRTQHYATYHGTNMELDLKKLIQWDQKKYLNIWVVNSVGEPSAYAQYPEIVDPDVSRYLDGIAINHTYLGMTGTAKFQFNRRHILTHEIGHWAGLRHCWAGDNNSSGTANCLYDDDICDTGNTVGDSRVIYPIDTTAVYESILFPYYGVDQAFDPDIDNIPGYPINLNDQNTNGNNILEESDLPLFCSSNSDSCFLTTINYAPIFNFMDYGAEFHFTQGQADRMRTVLNSPIADRDQIGLSIDRDDFFIAETNSLATITTKGVYFMENDLNDGSFLEDGIEIQLSHGSFSENISSSFSVSPNDNDISLEIVRNDQDFSKAIVKIVGNVPNHNVSDNDDIIVTFDSNAFLSQNLSLYRDSIRFKTFFLNDQLVDYNVYDISETYNFGKSYCSSVKGPDTMYAPIYIDRVGYLAIQYFDGVTTNVEGDTVMVPKGFYLVNESGRQVDVLCEDNDSFPLEIEYLNEEYDLNKNAPNGSKFDRLIRSPRNLNSNDESLGHLIFEDNQTFVEDQIVYIGLKISNACDMNEILGWIRIKIFPDGTTIEILDGLINYDPGPQSLLLENPLCIPSSEPDNIFLWIDKFELLDANGEGLVNESDANNDPTYTGYSDYSNSDDPLLSIEMNKNEYYQAKITRPNNNNSAYFYIWIDFDNDLFFEVDEKVLSASKVIAEEAGDNLDTILRLPENATPGPHKMRVAISLYPASISNTGSYEYSINPCGNIDNGEFEDYTITISDGEEGGGNCVESEIFSNFIPSGQTNTSDFIVIDGQITVANQEIVLRAGDSICINTGFDANGDDNVDFDAEIQICEVPDTNCLTSDSLALVALYNATNGPNWTNSWDLTQPVSTWSGINLDPGGCNVIVINLPSNNLVGYIPANLGDLNRLYYFDLRGNELSGGIPNDLGNIPTLEYIYLQDNNLSGSYPGSLCELPLLGCDFNFQGNPNLPNGGSDAGFLAFCEHPYTCSSNKLDLNDINSTIEFNDELNVFAYPNPVHSSIIFDINLSKEVDKIQVQIVNIQGKQVESFTINNLNIGLNSFEHSLEKLSPGIYNYVILSNSDKVVGKFIKN